MPEKINTRKTADLAKLPKLSLPSDASHKGQNGKLLIVGGSQLFHGASQWSFEVASRIVDMVFYASTPSNNKILSNLKQHLTDGLVIGREQVFSYAAEADVILVGPGMTRAKFPDKAPDFKLLDNLTTKAWQDDTYQIVNFLLAKLPEKKFVIDAGALQMVELSLLNKHHLLTPHHGEFEALRARVTPQTLDNLGETMILEKGRVDQIRQGSEQYFEIIGGNAGMTKGGTGDALAGLVAALYCNNEALTAAAWGSSVCKMAGDELYKKVGFFFNATDLAAQIPSTLWQLSKNSVPSV